jgi:hypothetical protein
MTNVVFVHGTGGRKEAYATTFQQIEQSLQQERPDAKLVPCLWGDGLGAKLNAGGASIPTYDDTQGGQEPSPEQKDIRLWEFLYKDPLYEMQLMGLRPLKGQTAPPGMATPSQELKRRVDELVTFPELQSTLNDLEIGIVFRDAWEAIVEPSSKPFGRLLETASRPLDEDYAAVARAIVSMARLMCEDQGMFLLLSYDDRLRDKAVEAILQKLTRNEQSKGIVGDWVKSQLAGFGLNLGTNHIKRRRGVVMDGAYPFAGDIMLYQSKGKKIRNFIRSQVEHLEPPIVLLAHSLGGIACVDLLIEYDLRDKVKQLITVGSQAPFFYEIDALQTLSFGEGLPDHFPKWLNIYDLRDFLSYVGNREGLFPGRLIDVEVDNRQPFPEAHSAYWANKQTWDAIKQVLP